MSSLVSTDVTAQTFGIIPASTASERSVAIWALHPTVKPVQLVADALMDCSERKALVLDTFAGSGTTIVAAQKTGRVGYGIEIDPIYCDVIIQRMQTLFGISATLTCNGASFDDTAAQRALSMVGVEGHG